MNTNKIVTTVAGYPDINRDVSTIPIAIGTTTGAIIYN